MLPAGVVKTVRLFEPTNKAGRRLRVALAMEPGSLPDHPLMFLYIGGPNGLGLVECHLEMFFKPGQHPYACFIFTKCEAGALLLMPPTVKTAAPDIASSLWHPAGGQPIELEELDVDEYTHTLLLGGEQLQVQRRRRT